MLIVLSKLHEDECLVMGTYHFINLNHTINYQGCELPQV